MTVTNEFGGMNKNSLTHFTQDMPSSTNVNNISYYNKCLNSSQTLPSHELPIMEEASFHFGQVLDSETFPESITTPQKPFNDESTILSPILTQKSISKSQDKIFQSKTRNHPLSRSKMRDLNSEISDSIDITFGDILHINNTENNTCTTVMCSIDDTLPVGENIEPKVENVVNNKDLKFKLSTVELSKENGPVLAAFCANDYFVLVQSNEINIWSISGIQELLYFHIGTLYRENIVESLGCQGNRVKVGDDDMFVCMELWGTEINISSGELSTTLKCSVYSCNITKKIFKSYILHLKDICG
ncbi:hypothetical protein L9F63_008755 [Diploptera punctata]|uniref:Uncharacterized protein n=1 Tax=Diploptera punctata TaxID=6984 RepID=A0AAD8E1D1_DIPPU|nr:hypothetical protein L9F63_008755 [Diploptera punctata]